MLVRELDNNEMEQINGGAITSAIINAVVGVIETILSLGEKTGASIRRMVAGELCGTR